MEQPTRHTESLKLEVHAVQDDKAAELVDFLQLLRLPLKVLGDDALTNLLDLTDVNCRGQRTRSIIPK